VFDDSLYLENQTFVYMENEIWKPVKNYESYYEVSNFGNVISVERYIEHPTHNYLKKQKLLTQFDDGRGYKHVKLYDEKGNPRNFTIHKLVALSFLDNPKNYNEINHIDHDKKNNRVNNLEWITRSENIKHSYQSRDPKTYKGSGNKMSKLTEEQVIQMRKDREVSNLTYKQLAEKYFVGITLVGYIINNKVWRHV